MRRCATRALPLGLCLGLTSGCPPEVVQRPCAPSAGTICTIAGSSRAGFAGDGGPGWTARLYLPMDAELGPGGHLYIVDRNNHRLRELVDPLATGATTDSLITTFAGTGMAGDGPPGPVLSTSLDHPTHIALDPAGRLWVAAWQSSRIVRIDESLSAMEWVAGTGARAYLGDDGPADVAVIDLPASVAADDAGNLFFVDQANQVIRRIDRASGVITRFAGMCVTNDEACAEGELPAPCADGSGKLRCGTDPDVCALPCQPAYGGDGGPAVQARFAFPFGQTADPAGRLAIARDGTLYVADTRNHRIRRVLPSGRIDTIAGTGAPGSSGDGGPALDAELNNPIDIEVRSDGSLFVTDTFSSCVRRIDADGLIHTVAGQCGRRGFVGDGGPATEALLDRPYGVELDEASGALYVTDTYNNRVRVVLPD